MCYKSRRTCSSSINWHCETRVCVSTQHNNAREHSRVARSQTENYRPRPHGGAFGNVGHPSPNSPWTSCCVDNGPFFLGPHSPPFDVGTPSAHLKARKQVQPKMCVLKCVAPGMANKRDKHTFRRHFPACRQPTTTIPPTFGTQSCVVAASFVSARVALPLSI